MDLDFDVNLDDIANMAKEVRQTSRPAGPVRYAPGKAPLTHKVPTKARRSREEEQTRAREAIDQLDKLVGRIIVVGMALAGGDEEQEREHAATAFMLLSAADGAITSIAGLYRTPEDDQRFQRLKQQVAGFNAALHPRIARTLRLPTGFSYIDRGTACDEKPDAEGCYLSSPQRERAVGTLRSLVAIAFNNFNTAIQNARIELLTSSSGGWSFLAEMLFTLGSGVVIGAALRGLRALKSMEASAAREAVNQYVMGLRSDDNTLNYFLGIDERTVVDVFNFASRGIKAHLKAHSKHALKGNAGKADFLKIVQEGLPTMQQTLIVDGFSVLDDVTLVGMVSAYSAEHHSVGMYADRVAGILRGFDSNRLGEVGAMQQHGAHLDAVRLTAFGKSRLALVQTEGDGMHGGARWDTGPRRPFFVRFVDDDYTQAAADFQRGRSGSEVSTVAVDDRTYPFTSRGGAERVPEVDQWVLRLREASNSGPMLYHTVPEPRPADEGNKGDAHPGLEPAPPVARASE